MTHRVKVVLSAVAIPIVLAAGLSPIFYRPFETPTQRAYRLCRQCADLDPTEVDDQILTVRSAPGSRADKLRLFIVQYDDPPDAEDCAPCAEAVLDAAEREDQSWDTASNRV